MFSFGGAKKKETKSEFEIDDAEDESGYVQTLRVNLTRLIAYAESADITLQREVAEKLANEAVKPARQVQIVEYGGLQLLLPLTHSTDIEVQRLAAHALANLSVNADNQVFMAKEGAIAMLTYLLHSNHELIQRQSAKALANLGVNSENKRKIAEGGALPRLIELSNVSIVSVKIEAIAAIANLAVNDANETEIVRLNGLPPIVNGMALASRCCAEGGSKGVVGSIEQYEELAAQCARALRNLSVNPANKAQILGLGALPHLQYLSTFKNDRISPQARRALRNLDGDAASRK